MSRQEYEMSEQDLDQLLEACKPVRYMVAGGMEPRSPQQNANDAWASLGRKMGFQHMTVQPISGKDNRFFTAISNEESKI
jgi:hypothetical protein